MTLLHALMLLLDGETGAQTPGALDVLVDGCDLLRRERLSPVDQWCLSESLISVDRSWMSSNSPSDVDEFFD
jgi:hypothetical protein